MLEPGGRPIDDGRITSPITLWDLSEQAIAMDDRDTVHMLRGMVKKWYSYFSQDARRNCEASMLSMEMVRLESYLTTGDPVVFGRAELD